MPRLLIAFATREGQTEKVAHRLADALNKARATVELVNAKDVSAGKGIDLSSFELLVFGASMHAGGTRRGSWNSEENNVQSSLNHNFQ